MLQTIHISVVKRQAWEDRVSAFVDANAMRLDLIDYYNTTLEGDPTLPASASVDDIREAIAGYGEMVTIEETALELPGAQPIPEVVTDKAADAGREEEGPAGIVCDALQAFDGITRAECFDGAEAGYFVRSDGREFRFSVEEIEGGDAQPRFEIPESGIIPAYVSVVKRRGGEDRISAFMTQDALRRDLIAYHNEMAEDVPELGEDASAEEAVGAIGEHLAEMVSLDVVSLGVN